MHEDRIGLPADNVANANENFEQRRNELNRRMMQLPMAERREHWKYYLIQLAELQKDDTTPMIGEPDARLRRVGDNSQKEPPAPLLETQDDAEKGPVMHPDEPRQRLATRSGGAGDKKRDRTQTEVGRGRLYRAFIHPA